MVIVKCPPEHNVHSQRFKRVPKALRISQSAKRRHSVFRQLVKHRTRAQITPTMGAEAAAKDGRFRIILAQLIANRIEPKIRVTARNDKYISAPERRKRLSQPPSRNHLF